MHLIEHEGDVAKLDFQPETKLVLLTQTTLSVDETADTIAALRARFPWIEMPPSSDICYATSNRQAAVKLVAEQSDCVVIVGSANSSNSVRLMEVGQEGLDARFSAADAPAKTGHAVRRIVWTMPANSTRHGSKAWRQWGFPRGIRAGDVCAGRDRCAAWHGVYGYGIRGNRQREHAFRAARRTAPPDLALIGPRRGYFHIPPAFGCAEHSLTVAVFGSPSGFGCAKHSLRSHLRFPSDLATLRIAMWPDRGIARASHICRRTKVVPLSSPCADWARQCHPVPSADRAGSTLRRILVCHPTTGSYRIAERYRPIRSYASCAARAGEMPPTTYPDSRMATFGRPWRLSFAPTAGQRLQIHMPAYRHHAHHAFGAGIGHQGFEHLMLVETEFVGGLDAIPVIHVVVGMLVFVGFEWNSGLFPVARSPGGTCALLMCFFFAMAPP